LQKALEHAADFEYLAQHSKLYYLDNKMIEHYSLPFEDQPFNLWQGQQEEMECLDEQVFLFNTRVTIKELEYLLSLPFSKFWAHLTKTDRV
jgi:hypothetical protein